MPSPQSGNIIRDTHRLPFTTPNRLQLQRAVRRNILLDTDEGDENAKAILQELNRFHTMFEDDIHFYAFLNDYRNDEDTHS